MDWKEILLWAVMAVLLVRMFLRRKGDRCAKEAMASGAQLVDVRTTGEFASGHLPSAKNIPLHELSGRLGELGAKDGALVVYCASGMRSARAKAVLEGAGFTKVYNLGSMSNG